MGQYLINSLTEMKSTIKELISHDRLAHDTETKGPDDKQDISGLYPFHGARSFAHIYATGADEFYFNFNTGGINPKYKQDLQEIHEDPKRLIFYVNAIFDNTIMHFDGLENKCRIADIGALARVEFNEHGKIPGAEEENLSLEYLSNYYGVQIKDDRVKKYIQENNLYSPVRCRFTGEKIPLYNLVPLDIIFAYGCGDGRSTYDTGVKIVKCINYKDELYENQRKYAGKLIDVAKNEIKLQTVLVDMKIEGFKVDQEYTKKAIAYETENLNRLTSEVKKLTGDINLNSGAQVAEYLLKRGVKLPRKKPTPTMIERAAKWTEKAIIAHAAGKTKQYEEAKTKAAELLAGNPQTDKKTLAKLVMKYPDLDFLTKLTQAKEAEKKIGTYYENFLLLMDENGVIHCGLNPGATKTGRFSSSDPNLQNLEKKPAVKEWGVRKAFYCPDPDFDLFLFDYSQQEMIVMLDQAEEMKVIERLLSKEFEDFYLATIAVLRDVAGIEVTRQQAKAIALGLAYGQGKELLAHSLGMTLQKAEEFINDFFRALPALKAFKKALENQVKWYGKIHNPFGRVSYLDKDHSYKALNSFVQGTSADITKTAMVNIHAFLKANKLRSKMILCVHDELILKIHKDERNIVSDIRRIMTEAYPHKHIPLGTDVEFSATSWGEKEKYAAA